MIKYILYRTKNKPKEKKRKGVRPITLWYILPVATVIVLGFFSCKGGKDSLTRQLFLQSKRANVELPENKVDFTGRAQLSEKVSYSHEDNISMTIYEQDSIQKARKNSLNEVQHLREVTVTARAKQKFAPERNGKVSLDFMIRVPKELLSADWRVSLLPKLLHNDSVVPLDPVVLKGKHFLEKQKADYRAFVDYEASIIAPSAYDSLFLDRKGIAKDMRSRQGHYWDLYDRQFKRVIKYQRWKDMMQDRYSHYNMQKDGNRLNLYHSYRRKQYEETIALLTTGADTAGIAKKYARKFERRAGLLPMYHMQRELTEKNVPRKYRDFFLNEPKPEDLSNYSTTEKDSVEIAKHRYFFNRITENENKDRRRREMEERIIPLPMEADNRLDSIISGDKDFLYYYTLNYPVTPGLEQIGITMSGKVTATDLRGFTLPNSDTLHYVISSLVQLADTSLIIRRTRLFRNMFDKMTIYPQFKPNKSDFKVGNSKAGYSNKQVVDTIMSHYHKLTREMGLQMDSLEITSWTSLDGSYDTNYKLSQKRGESLAAYLQNNYLENITYNIIKVIPKGEDWQSFINEVHKRDDIPNKDFILDKIQCTVHPDKTEEEIHWGYKEDYKIIREEIYPKLKRMDITFSVSRPGMAANDSIIQEVKDGYKEGLKLLLNRQYWEALEILKDYPDYNTALCLACMGYNGRAYDLLLKLDESDNNEYLLAIVTQRMDKDEEAVQHLLRAIELNPQKAYRSNLDSEIIQLVAKYNLQYKIDEMSQVLDRIETIEREEQEQSIAAEQQCPENNFYKLLEK
ncbi:hypothetical protein JGH11_15500 [Dysgonomonas sp. Marseille-P4677]|uniref:hypothetical protein n=1 Tax=Dysgonomonas sp. Marseille-P4677 TaxID=2364790 RepID=UPI001914B54F|nr:hypothetical protein [Dysgonomonas sp. Marseille-P4677]MBK5722281.1 hypothetical protein [Dysgonomonas sp. Marseille-P4677]